MKQLIAGALLLLFSAVTFAATEIWMMHDPDCYYCNLFLKDHNLEGNDRGKVPLYENTSLLIVNLYDPQNTPDRVIDAINAQKLTSFEATPHFYRWDTETKTLTGTWTGWNAYMAPTFRHWVLTGNK